MYLLLKLLHIVSVIALLGNITTGLFWHAHAARTRDPKLLAHVMDGIIHSDRYFTIPGVIGTTAAGFALAIYGQFPILRTQVRAYARAGAQSGSFDYARYRALAVRWELRGAAALLTPLAMPVLRVLKPGL